MFARRGDSRIARKNIRNDNYKQISAEILHPLPICVIMGLHRRAGACSRRNECLESKKGGGSKPPPYKGVWALPDAKRCLQRCNTKAKLAIKRNDNKKLTDGGIIWEKFLALGAE